MKKLFFVLASAGVVLLQACDQVVQTDQAAPANTATAEVSLESHERRLSYGIAVGFARQMQTNKVDLQPDAFMAGLTDVLEGRELKLTQEEINTEMSTFQKASTEKREAERLAQGETNVEEGKAYLAENATREGVTVTESGLQYEVITEGEGARPGPEDTVEVHYRGTLLDGREFDSSYKRNQTASFALNQVIPGWTEGLQLMPAGSKYKFAIPSELAYGSGGAGGMIGPNATLLFEVELISVKPKEG